MPIGDHFVDDDLRVLLHVGVPKTATTAIQTCLAARREDLRERGVLYPGQGSNQQPQLRDLLAVAPTSDPSVSPDWSRMASRVRAHRGRSVISDESAALASPAMAQRIVDDLGTEGVHVVITLRPLEVLLSSMWQQELKMRGPSPRSEAPDAPPMAFDDWLADVTRGPRPGDRPPNLFWYLHDHPAVVRNWMSAVGPRRVHVVVVDRSTPNIVFEAFTRLIGLPPGFLDAQYSSRSNRSLTWPEAEMVRRIDERLYASNLVNEFGGINLLTVVNFMIEHRQPPTDEPSIHVPKRYVERIRVESRRAVDDLATLGVDVIGDLEALCPTTAIPDVHNPAVTSIPIDVVASLFESFILRRAKVTRR